MHYLAWRACWIFITQVLLLGKPFKAEAKTLLNSTHREQQSHLNSESLLVLEVYCGGGGSLTCSVFFPWCGAKWVFVPTVGLSLLYLGSTSASSTGACCILQPHQAVGIKSPQQCSCTARWGLCADRVVRSWAWTASICKITKISPLQSPFCPFCSASSKLPTTETARQHCGLSVPISLEFSLTVRALFFVYCVQDKDDVVPLLPLSFFKLPSVFLSKGTPMLFSLHQPHRLHFPAPHVTARRQEWEWGRCEGHRGADSHKNCDWVEEKGQQNLRLAHNSAAFHPFFADLQVVFSGNSSSFCDNFLWTLDFPSLFPFFEDTVRKFNIFFTIHFASIFFWPQYTFWSWHQQSRIQKWNSQLSRFHLNYHNTAFFRTSKWHTHRDAATFIHVMQQEMQGNTGCKCQRQWCVRSR